MKNQNIPMKRLFTSLCALLVSLTALTARAQTVTVIDPQGDAFYSNGNEAPPFLDILAASFMISDTLTFTIDVAGSLDALPDPPGSHGVFAWHFALNTDDSTDPPGFPFPRGQTAPADFGLDAIWDGTAFSGVLYDRRPALMGQPALLYSIPVNVSGSRITSQCPRRWRRRYSQRLCCPARPGIAPRSGVLPDTERMPFTTPTRSGDNPGPNDLVGPLDRGLNRHSKIKQDSARW